VLRQVAGVDWVEVVRLAFADSGEDSPSLRVLRVSVAQAEKLRGRLLGNGWAEVI
jgi:hypothetical protein